jgi:uncharacterized protein (TIGR02271 family)
MPKVRTRDNLTTAKKRATRAEIETIEIERTDAVTMQQQHRGEDDRAEREVVVPVVAEELKVGKRTVETGLVRVTKRVREHEEVIDQPLLKTNVVVRRVPVNQYVEKAPEVRQEGDTLVVPMVEEVIVVEKRLILREELRITKQQVETRNPQRVTVRRDEVKIDRINPEEVGAGGTDVAKPTRSRRS